MKKSNYSNHALFILVLIIVFSQSCTDNFDELNTKPDAISVDNVDASLIGQAFAQSQNRGMAGVDANGSVGLFQITQTEYADVYCQYFAMTAKNFPFDLYVQDGDVNYSWILLYRDAAPQIQLVENYTKEHDLPVENALAKIWRVQFYDRITDYWGPIIYSEFGNGKTSVPYDTQESIYMDFFKTLNNSIEVLKKHQGENAFRQSDLIFGGNVTKWLKFANSLKLRLAMRIRFVNRNKAKMEAEASLDPNNGGVLESNEDNAGVLTTENNRNPYATLTNYGEFRMSATMESFLEGFNDPRISEYFSPAVNGDSDGDGSPYEGFRNGVPKAEKNQAELDDANSDMAPKYLNSQRGGTNPPIPIMNASEVYFLRAEGALIGWDMGGGTAKSYYEKGIRTSLKNRTNITDSDINKYIYSGNTPVSPQDKYSLPPISDIPVAFDISDTLERKLEQIITQKWLALYPNSLEAFSELRRTGYPRQYERIASLNPDVGPGEIFRRMTFVRNELSNNSEAVKAAQNFPELKAGDKNSTHLWWDKKQNQPSAVGPNQD